MTMQRPVFLLLIIGCTICLYSGISVSGEVKPYFHSDMFLQSEPISIDGALHEWRKGKYRGGESQYGSVWLETGVKKGDTALSALHRQEYQATFSPDAADYYYGTQHHQLDPNRSYRLELETHSFKAQGVRVQQTFQPSKKLTLSVGGSILQASSLQDGRLSGQAITDASGKDQTYEASVRYQYDQDRLLDRPDVIAPKGIGYALDASLQWQATDKLAVGIAARDIVGEINWDDTPYTDAKLTSTTKTVGDDGFIKIQPGVQGKEAYLDSFRQTLRPKLDASAKYRIGETGETALLALKHVPEQTLWGVGGETPALKGTIAATLWPEGKLLQVGYTRKHVELSVGLDNINPADANTVWLELGIH